MSQTTDPQQPQAVGQSVDERLVQMMHDLKDEVSLADLQETYQEKRKKLDAGNYGYYPDEKSKVDWTLSVVFGNFVGRPTLYPYAVIPVAFEPKSTTKNGSFRAAILALISSQSNPDWQGTSISCQGDTADLVNTVGLFQQYPSVKLGRYKAGGDLFADARSKFEQAVVQEGLDPITLYQQYFQARYVTIAESEHNPTATDATGYPIRKDLRIIRAFITRKGGGKRADGSKWANYSITDNTVKNEVKTTPDGRQQYPGMTVWCDPTLQKFNADDQCDFVGNVVANKTGTGKERKPDGTYAMNAFNIVPVHIDASQQQAS